MIVVMSHNALILVTPRHLHPTACRPASLITGPQVFGGYG